VLRKLSHIQTYADRHGRERCYYRHGSYRVALPSPSAPDFMVAYAKAQADDPLPITLRGQADNRILRPAVVYVIECAGRVKIGHSTNVRNRLAGISTSAPAAATICGTVEFPDADMAGRYERRLHERFAASRSNGEWFDIPVTTALEALAEIEAELNRVPVSGVL
jgi:hypothetical protein